MDRSDPSSAEQLQLPRTLRDSLLEWAGQARPAEACGLLIGERLAGRIEVLHATRAHNLSADPARYEIDPADHLAAQLEARRAGLDVVGAWHSHPQGPAAPSPSDEREALAGWAYLIVDARAGILGAWRLDASGRLVEVALGA